MIIHGPCKIYWGGSYLGKSEMVEAIAANEEVITQTQISFERVLAAVRAVNEEATDERAFSE